MPLSGFSLCQARSFSSGLRALNASKPSLPSPAPPPAAGAGDGRGTIDTRSGPTRAKATGLKRWRGNGRERPSERPRDVLRTALAFSCLWCANGGAAQSIAGQRLAAWNRGDDSTHPQVAVVRKTVFGPPERSSEPGFCVSMRYHILTYVYSQEAPGIIPGGRIHEQDYSVAEPPGLPIRKELPKT